MRLTPLTSWFCLACGHRTDRGFPPRSCCPHSLPIRLLVGHQPLASDEREALNLARDGALDELAA